MDTPTPSLAAETEMLRQAYAALNRNDIPAFIAMFDPQIERIEHIGQVETFRGLEAVKAHIEKARATWAEGGCEPQRFTLGNSAPHAPENGGDRIVVLVHVRVRLKNETQWREGDTVDVYTFRNGKVIEFRTFADQRQAFEWAGVKIMEADRSF